MDATAFVAADTPGPRGSTGSARATRYGLDRSATQPLLLAPVENREAVANIRAIAATPGLEGVVIDPSDLSADLVRAMQLSGYTDAASIKSGIVQRF